MKRIEDEPNPVVGEYYLVPHIDHPGVKANHRWLPIVGPWHEDAEIVSFPDHHFHYDWRFMPANTLSRPIELSHAYPATHKQGLHGVRPQHEMPTVYLRRKMRRAMPDFPTANRDGQAVEFVKKLEKVFASQTLKCRTCPHKGMPLEGMPMDAEGRVVCPGHGLRWNLKTGKLSPRMIATTK